MIRRTGRLIALVLLAGCAVSLLAVTRAEEKGSGETLEAELARLEKLTIAYAAAAEKGDCEKERKAVHDLREKIAARGPSALAAVMKQLRHRHVNVRRGAATLCCAIIDRAEVPDRELLEKVLEHLVTEGDLKCRSNLRNVALYLVDDLVAAAKKTK
ncbi:MAG: hypothetical protein ACYTDY_12150 [Planctomycetota bacterium]|jgi:hypothetical protein